MRDYLLYAILRINIIILRLLPLSVWLFLARRCAVLYYYICGQRNRKAYANLKTAFAHKSRGELKGIMKSMYQNFAQNLVETLYVSFVDEAFIRKYVFMPDAPVVKQALGENKGVILLGSHAGSWELSNIACSIFFKEGKYAMLAQPQTKFKRLDNLLNEIRESKGCHVIRTGKLKELISHLGSNNILGTVADHGGRDGIAVEFFSKLAMTPAGSIKLAKKNGSRIILAFMRRVKGPYHELFFKPYDLLESQDAQEDLKTNLRNINKIFEEWITKYPSEYLWFYRRWKYSPQKNILVLSDGRLGHLKQSLAVVDSISEIGLQVSSETVGINFKSQGLNRFFSFIAAAFGPAAALNFLPLCIKKEALGRIMGGAFDIIVSTGSSVAAVNMACAYENNSLSISVMKPGILPLSEFSCVIMPEHDNPPSRKNIITCSGALNSVDKESMEKDYISLCERFDFLKDEPKEKNPKIGLLLGGNSKNYFFTAEIASLLCRELKEVSDKLDGHLFITTSQRTPKEVSDALKDSFKNYNRCKMLVVASEENPKGTVGGIFHLSDVVVVSAESISMVSEAASSGKYVVAFEPGIKHKKNKIKKFLTGMENKKHIYLVGLKDIGRKIDDIVKMNPGHSVLDSKNYIRQELKKRLF